ncbi:hypothetical protein P3T36_004643 [Kitasatospora sp. MAP12-15]|uniref:hypothetical protein n=1 Tax=unclassified Kitasatospora TaxID=2633591 RepID=UPI002475C85D|nr:hypothetical protein [Kitasatospora sp. MAP12-44]MDH6111489.1 hypothetical protein [Kitasatospora sp. MAP12-44]
MLKQIAVSCAVLALTLAGTTAATAAPQHTAGAVSSATGDSVTDAAIKTALATGHKVKIETTMRVSGYNRAVADKNGYKILTAPNGVEYSVKKDASPTDLASALKKAEAVKPTPNPATSKGVVTPNVSGELWGDCGGASVEFDPWGDGTRGGDLYTSFYVYSKAWFYSWEVDLVDNGGVSAQDWGPTTLAADNSWNGHRALGGLTAGPGHSVVNDTHSWAYTVDGGTCTAGPVTVFYTIS